MHTFPQIKKEASCLIAHCWGSSFWWLFFSEAGTQVWKLYFPSYKPPSAENAAICPEGWQQTRANFRTNLWFLESGHFLHTRGYNLSRTLEDIKKHVYLVHMYMFPGELMSYMEQNLFRVSGYLSSLQGKVIMVMLLLISSLDGISLPFPQDDTRWLWPSAGMKPLRKSKLPSFIVITDQNSGQGQSVDGEFLSPTELRPCYLNKWHVKPCLAITLPAERCHKS